MSANYFKVEEGFGLRLCLTTLNLSWFHVEDRMDCEKPIARLNGERRIKVGKLLKNVNDFSEYMSTLICLFDHSDFFLDFRFRRNNPLFVEAFFYKLHSSAMLSNFNQELRDLELNET